MRKIIVGGLVTAGIAAVGYWLQSTENDSAAPAAMGAVTAAAAAQPQAGGGQWPANPYGDPATQRGDSPLLPTESYRDAASSMAEARLNGDPRTPPLQRSAEQEAPTAEELADPDKYKQYEARQSKKLYAAYIQASDSEVPKLKQLIERGKAEGVSAEEIAQAEEKVRRIQQMRDKLLASNPDLRP